MNRWPALPALVGSRSVSKPPAGTGTRRRPGRVLTVLLGSAGGQGLVILSTPVLTRFYDPNAFGLLSVFSAISAVLATGMVMRLDSAITLPRSARGAAAVAHLAAVLAASLTILAGVFGTLVGAPVARFFNTPALAHYWWLLAVATLLLAFDQLMLGWLTRNQRYSSIARRNFSVGLGQVVVQLALGALHFGSTGLLLGMVAGRLCGLGGLLSKGGLLRQGAPQPRLMRAATGTYRRFIYVGVWSALINSIGSQVPLLVIGAAYGQHVVGLTGLTFRILAAPAALIGLAVAWVFKAEVSEVVRKPGASGVRDLIVKNSRTLLLLGTPVAIIIIIFGPPGFRLAFGPEWTVAGEYARYLAVGYLFQLVVSPVSNTLVLLNKQGAQLAWDAGRMALTVGTPAVCAIARFGPAVAVMVLSVSYVVSYGLLYVLCLRVARDFDQRRSTDATNKQVNPARESAHPAVG